MTDFKIIRESNDLQKQWQANWREILGESTSEMPEDVGSDFALHFDIWELSNENLQECFSLFPNGLKMLDRANAVRSTVRESKDIKDDELLVHLNGMNDDVEKILVKAGEAQALEQNNAKKACNSMKVHRGDEKFRMKIFSNANSPTITLDDIMRGLFEKKFGVQGYASYEFLSNPFYRISHDMVVADGILWAALIDEYNADPYQSVIDLHTQYAQAGWSNANKEMFVFLKE